MAPFALAPIAGGLVEFAVFLAIGIAFGAVLEMSGFGDSRKLAAQFYLREMTVLKVMFTGIVVAAVLIHFASAAGLVDLQKVWINPTYLWPGIVGGLIMGVGFIVGGFCPGTSLVAAATLKLDGIFFVLGGIAGVGIFGETVGRFDDWWRSSFYGRFTIADWLGLPAGVAVLLLVLMALGMFVLAEAAERRFGERGAEPGPRRVATRGRAAAATLVLGAVVVMALGQPSLDERWARIADRGSRELADRAVFVDPGEVVALRRDLTISTRFLEVRSESDYNLFHLAGSRRIDLEDTANPLLVRRLAERPENQILFLVGNGEETAVQAWKRLRAQGIINLYVIEGGINNWLEIYPPDPCFARRDDGPAAAGNQDLFAWRFELSVGDRIPSAHPDLTRRDPPPDCGGRCSAIAAAAGSRIFDGRNHPERAYARRVSLQKKSVAKGGCG